MMEDNSVAATTASINVIYVGLRFEPSDALIMGFLYDKVTGMTLNLGDDSIQECDLYGDKEPWEIWDLYGGANLKPPVQDLYFFTQLKKKTSKGSRINRSVGSGTWMGEDAGKPITYSRLFKNPMGFKKRFRYEDGAAQQVGAWIMHEYSLDSSVHNNENGYVLCRLRKNDRMDKKRKLMINST